VRPTGSQFSKGRLAAGAQSLLVSSQIGSEGSANDRVRSSGSRTGSMWPRSRRSVTDVQCLTALRRTTRAGPTTRNRLPRRRAHGSSPCDVKGGARRSSAPQWLSLVELESK
jgi:hypothetical protein